MGPTGAAKILFALRPHAFVPWDGRIRESLGYDGRPAAYVAYLREVKSVLESIERACHDRGFELADLPRQLGSPTSTVPRLIDEYLWVTVTQGYQPPSRDVLRTIDLIDALWFEKGTNKIVCAFEVEKSTSIYSGILRLTDLALTLSGVKLICLVAPDERENEIIAQLKRPSISAGKDTNISYILFSELCEHCESICKFGNDYTILEKIAKRSK